jgi:signal transduction histidine kinase
MMINITLVFFIYGLAFFSMGLALMQESGRSPLLANAKVLLPLAAFGLIHGTHEWLEMFLDRSDWLVIRYPTQVGWLRLGVLALSFSCLIAFGLETLHPQRQLSASGLLAKWGGLALYVLLAFLVGLTFLKSHADWLTHVDASLRYLLAIPGALLAGAALLSQANQTVRQGLYSLGVSLRWAAWGFILYAFTQAVVPPLDVFPGRFINTTTFFNLTGMPIQFVRALMAVVITVSLIRATHFADEERQHQLQAAQQARLNAMEQLHHELIERETMRQELLRHTVIAQEEERARIARELHDETFQVLAAFNLHLAALRQAMKGNAKEVEHIDQLLQLSHQVYEGIYQMVRDLRPAQLDDLGLVAALQFLAEETQNRFGLQARLEINGSRQRLAPLAETVLFRVAQEAITNVVRHAEVKEAIIQLSFRPEQIVLRVSDRGIGFDVNSVYKPPRGWGLIGMRERAESVGGKLNLISSPGKGTVVEFIVPAVISS